MEERARREGVPISSPETGRLLEVLAAATRPALVLELGGAIGYGALRLARGAPGARVISVERDPERAAVARTYLERGEVADRVEVVEREAIEFLTGFEGRVGLVYLDCDKRQYRRCLDLVLPKVEVGGAVVADNLLWKGRIADPSPGEEEPEARALEAFNGYLTMHPQLLATVLPVGDGVGVAVKTRPLVTELGGPF